MTLQETMRSAAEFAPESYKRLLQSGADRIDELERQLELMTDAKLKERE